MSPTDRPGARARRAVTAAVAAVLMTAAALVVSTGPARAETTGNYYYLQARVGSGTLGGSAHFGSASDEVLTGDWDGNGTDTLAVRRGNVFIVTDSVTGGAAAYSFRYGSPGDQVVVGDWNGDGKDTVGIRRGNQFFLTNATHGGAATSVFRFGSAGDGYVVGDWNGDRKDTLGVRRGNTYLLTDGRNRPIAVTAKFGSAADTVITGDWNGDRKDTLGVRRGNTYYLTNNPSGGATAVTEVFGSPDDSLVVGDWNADHTDTLGVRRAAAPPLIVVQHRIPYPQHRRDEMAAYAKAHYGTRTSTLTPTAVVLHFTESDSVAGVISYFSQDSPNMGVLPGVCSHYLVAKDGTVYQLVSTDLMCRHTVGLNHRAVGIEVIQSTQGHSSAWADQQILNRPAQMRSLLLLVAMLQDKYAIATTHVYGHGTANGAPEFVDLLGWTNTHTDWGPTAVAEFRSRLDALT